MAPAPKPDFKAMLDRYLDDIDEFEDWRSNTETRVNPAPESQELRKVA
jgi:hypothetical protein